MATNLVSDEVDKDFRPRNMASKAERYVSMQGAEGPVRGSVWLGENMK
jgi:hypothetical protein